MITNQQQQHHLNLLQECKKLHKLCYSKYNHVITLTWMNRVIANYRKRYKRKVWRRVHCPPPWDMGSLRIRVIIWFFEWIVPTSSLQKKKWNDGRRQTNYVRLQWNICLVIDIILSCSSMTVTLTPNDWRCIGVFVRVASEL